jgi:hypothetical protein
MTFQDATIPLARSAINAYDGPSGTSAMIRRAAVVTFTTKRVFAILARLARTKSKRRTEMNSYLVWYLYCASVAMPAQMVERLALSKDKGSDDKNLKDFGTDIFSAFICGFLWPVMLPIRLLWFTRKKIIKSKAKKENGK